MEYRVAEQKTISIVELNPAEYNPRRQLQPGDEEYEKIKRSIERFGFADPVVVNKDMTIIGGHQRINVALDLGYTEVPCAIVDLDKDDEKALNIALNKISGEWDDEKLADLLQGLSLRDYDTTLTGYSDDERNALFNNLRLENDEFNEADISGKEKAVYCITLRFANAKDCQRCECDIKPLLEKHNGTLSIKME